MAEFVSNYVPGLSEQIGAERMDESPSPDIRNLVGQVGGCEYLSAGLTVSKADPMWSSIFPQEASSHAMTHVHDGPLNWAMSWASSLYSLGWQSLSHVVCCI